MSRNNLKYKVLGAGASISSGTSLNRAVVERVVGVYDLKKFDEYLNRCSDDERFSILRDLVEGTLPSKGYQSLTDWITRSPRNPSAIAFPYSILSPSRDIIIARSAIPICKRLRNAGWITTKEIEISQKEKVDKIAKDFGIELADAEAIVLAKTNNIKLLFTDDKSARGSQDSF